MRGVRLLICLCIALVALLAVTPRSVFAAEKPVAKIDAGSHVIEINIGKEEAAKQATELLKDAPELDGESSTASSGEDKEEKEMKKLEKEESSSSSSSSSTSSEEEQEQEEEGEGEGDSKMYIVPRQFELPVGSLGVHLETKQEGDGCTDNCDAREVNHVGIAGPVAMSAPIGENAKTWARARGSSNRASPPQADDRTKAHPLVEPENQKVDPMHSQYPITGMANIAPRFQELRRRIRARAATAASEAPTPAAGNTSPRRGDRVPAKENTVIEMPAGSSKPAKDCGCSICPCPSLPPFPKLLPEDANRLAAEQENDAKAKEVAAKREKLSEELYKHQANYNAIGRLSRAVQEQYAELQRTHAQLKMQLLASKHNLKSLDSEGKNEFDIDAQKENIASITEDLNNKQKLQTKILQKSYKKQQWEVCMLHHPQHAEKCKELLKKYNQEAKQVAKADAKDQAKDAKKAEKEEKENQESNVQLGVDAPSFREVSHMEASKLAKLEKLRQRLKAETDKIAAKEDQIMHGK